MNSHKILKNNRLDNPFVVSGYFGPEYFCDREQETEDILSALENGWNISLIAPRRIGKTGLIMRLLEVIERTSDTKCFYVDIFSTKNITEFVQALSRTIVGKLDTSFEKASKKAMRLFSAFRPALSLDPQTGTPVFSFNISPDQAQDSLESIFNYIKSSGKKCCIAIDEFQQVNEYPESGIEALLRSYIQFMPDTRFIFAGSKLHMMREMFLSPSRPFFQSTRIMELGVIDESKYLDFANSFFAEQKRELSAPDFHQLYNDVDGQTYYVQTVLNKIYSHPSLPLDSDLIHSCLWEAINEQVPTFQYVMDTLTANQSSLLKAVAREGNVKEPLGRQFSQKYLLPSKSSLKLALDYLIRHQLVYKDSSRGVIVYDRFMGKWLASLLY